MQPTAAQFARCAWPVATAALLCRVVVLLILPPFAVSNDLGYWLQIAEMLDRHQNPYATTPYYLGWPPFWMQVIAALNFVAHHTAVPLSYLIRAFLITADVINTVLALLIASRFSDLRAATRAVLLGLAINPVAVLFVCQHGNFDGLVATSLLVFALALLSYLQTGDAVDWLIASFALGIGTLIKTVPLLLSPLLAVRASRLSIRARILGIALLLLPVSVGMSVIFVLAPVHVVRSVLGNRSYSGWFGITGVLQVAGLTAVKRLYESVFSIVAVGLLVALGWRLRRSELRPEQIILLIATILAALIAFSPGYGAQYIAWLLPFFAITFAAFDDRWKRDLITAWVVSIIVYTIEYALTPDMGPFLIGPHSSPQLRYLSDILADDEAKTLLRLPLFAVYVWLIFAARSRLRSSTSAALNVGP